MHVLGAAAAARLGAGPIYDSLGDIRDLERRAGCGQRRDDYERAAEDGECAHNLGAGIDLKRESASEGNKGSHLNSAIATAA